MKVIGLTGGTGSGKSVVSKSLAAAGAVVIDADKIAHEIILKGEPAYQEIVKYYGTGILDAKGNIIRRRLGEIVFHDAEKLAFLNQCTHKYICAEVDRQIAKAEKENTARAVILDAPLLLEAGLESRCDTVWVVYADPEVRAKRVMARDGVSYDLAKAKEYLEKSGIDPKTVSFSCICSDDVKRRCGEVIQSNLQELGITMNLESMDLATYLSAAAEGNFDACIGGYTTNNMMNFIDGKFTAKQIGGSNWTRTNDPKLDELYTKATSDLNEETRTKTLEELTAYINELCPQVPTYGANVTRAYNSNLQGIEVSATNALYWGKVSWAD